MSDEKPEYCVRPEISCFWCELSADGVDCQKNSFSFNLLEVIEEPVMVLETFDEDEDFDLMSLLEEPDHTEYCTQNGGDCSTCSLVNYGLDCQNNRVSDRKTAD